MEDKKKRKVDTVPEIIMNGTETGTFSVPYYPDADSECPNNDIPDDYQPASDDGDNSYDGDVRPEHRL